MSTKRNTYISSAQVDAILPMLAACGVEVTDSMNGFVVCPGIHLHTTVNGPRDCIVYNNNGIPRLHCFHQSCRAMRDALNVELYRSARSQSGTRQWTAPTKQFRMRQQARATARARLKREQKLAASSVQVILHDYHWPADAMVSDSPVPVDLPVEQHWRYILELFPVNDVIWIGRDKHDSGSPRHQDRFRSASQWLSLKSCPGAFICPNAFRRGVYKRRVEHVLTPRFLVLESDDVLNRDQVGAVFRWVESGLNLRLCAVVDSGNKSLHGWFEYPPPNMFQKMRLWLSAMGCDRALFTLNQPCRLPGAWRSETERHQRLLYLA